jgi:hypothetical protein
MAARIIPSLELQRGIADIVVACVVQRAFLTH